MTVRKYFCAWMTLWFILEDLLHLLLTSGKPVSDHIPAATLVTAAGSLGCFHRLS